MVTDNPHSLELSHLQRRAAMFAGGVVCQRGPQGTGKGEKVVVVGRTGWCALLVVSGVGGYDNKSDGEFVVAVVQV